MSGWCLLFNLVFTLRPSSRLTHLFKASFCMEDGPAKPDPFPVTRAAELLGVKPADTALVRCPPANQPLFRWTFPT